MPDTIQIQGLGGVFLYASDAAALAAWYTRVFDIPLLQHEQSWFSEWPSAHRSPGSPRAARVVFAIFQADRALPDVKTARIALRIDDLDQAGAALEALGCPVRRGPASEDYGRFAWVDDPEGNTIELWEPPLAGA